MGLQTDSQGVTPSSGGGSGVRVMVFVNKGVTNLAIDEIELTRQEDMDDFARQVGETIDRLQKPNIIINFENVRLICSRLLGHIVALNKRIVARGGRLKLAAVNPDIRKVFTLTGLDKTIKMYDSVEGATRSFKINRLFDLLGGKDVRE